MELTTMNGRLISLSSTPNPSTSDPRGLSGHGLADVRCFNTKEHWPTASIDDESTASGFTFQCFATLMAEDPRALTSPFFLIEVKEDCFGTCGGLAVVAAHGRRRRLLRDRNLIIAPWIPTPLFCTSHSQSQYSSDRK